MEPQVPDPIYRPRDDRYWMPTWSRVLFAGDLFAAIPFVDQGSGPSVRADGHGKHFIGPIAYGYGLLISPTCDMVDQRTLQVSHPYRVLVPVLPLETIAEGAPGTAANLGLLRKRDSVVPYMYLPPMPGVLGDSAACLFRPTIVADGELLEVPRRIAQLGPEGRRQLKIKLIRYWGRLDPERDAVNGQERDEDRFAAAPGDPSPYDIDVERFPEDMPTWE
jgi:hypothetical protein